LDFEAAAVAAVDLLAAGGGALAAVLAVQAPAVVRPAVGAGPEAPASAAPGRRVAVRGPGVAVRAAPAPLAARGAQQQELAAAALRAAWRRLPGRNS